MEPNTGLEGKFNWSLLLGGALVGVAADPACASVSIRDGIVREGTMEKRAVFSAEGFVETVAGVKVNSASRLVTKLPLRNPSLGNLGGVWRV
jgi:hypothetical protein